jgi:putative ABC transport system permease protein
MKFLPYLLKHLRRNWFRTGLTVVAMAVCIFLFCTLQSVLAEVNSLLDSTSANRLVTRHAVSLVFNLPLSYKARIEGVEGVKRVSVNAWFGGSLPAEKEEVISDSDSSSTTDFSNFFPNMAVEPEPFLAMYPEYELPPEQYQAFLQDLRGAVIGRTLADKFGWKVGDTFFLESFIPPYRKPDGPFEFVVKGIFDTDEARYPGTDTNMMLFNYKYLYEATGRNVGAGTYYVEIEDPDRAGEISAKIDSLFENSDAATRTETEKAFAASFVSMAGNLALLLNGIGLAVTFTILLVVANTMSIAVRERRTEIAVLKTLGFKSGQVMGLVVAESVLIGVLGGLIGVGGAEAILWTLTHAPGIKDALAGLGLSSLSLRPIVAVLGFGNALFLAFLAGFFPALGAYRARITDMLRTV